MGMLSEFVGRLGYTRVDYNEVSTWAQSKCRYYQKIRSSGYRYFIGKRHMYAVYYHRGGDYTIYRKMK